jgi:hypothetical protein
MSRKQPRRDNPIKEDIQNIKIIIIGAGLLMLLWLIAIITLAIIEYWYISLPCFLIVAYIVYTKGNKPIPAQIPVSSTIRTIEQIKINNGTRQTITNEVYTPNIPKGIFRTIADLISG